MKILDLSAGNRAVWFDKKHPLAVYIDKRPEVNPDIVCDSTALPEAVGSGYDLVVFDPPHMNCGRNSNMSKCYGYHTTAEILKTVEGTAKEAHRVTGSGGLMAFKWNTHDINLKRILKLMGQWEPLFGHITKIGPGSQTYWVLLKKREPGPEPVADQCKHCHMGAGCHSTDCPEYKKGFQPVAKGDK
jgi:hypothetical protein